MNTWKIDIAHATATHERTGLIVKLTQSADGTVTGRPIAPVPAGIGLDNGPALIREAGEAYLEAILEGME